MSPRIGDIRAFMTEYGISARKKYGQNFLIDDNILDTIVDGAGIGGEDTVLEIGPGLGAMTGLLAMRARRVIAVEIDSALIPALKVSVSGHDNVEIINEDILKCDIDELNSTYADGQGLCVTANLPYYITTPIILRLLEKSKALKNITVMVQKEVAQRMKSGPGSKDYGALSLAVQFYSEPEILTEVGPECFYPSPAVDSAVIKLNIRSASPVDVSDPDHMFKLIRATFNMRRKTMPNALCAGMPGLDRESVTQALSAMGKNPDVRGETFSLAEFAELSNLLTGSR